MLHNGDPLASLHFPPQGKQKNFFNSPVGNSSFSRQVTAQWTSNILKQTALFTLLNCCKLRTRLETSKPGRCVKMPPPSQEGPSEANLRACQSRMMSQASLSLHRWVLGIPTNWWTSVGVGHESVIKIYSYSNKSWFLYSLTSINTYLAMQSWG